MDKNSSKIPRKLLISISRKPQSLVIKARVVRRNSSSLYSVTITMTAIKVSTAHSKSRCFLMSPWSVSQTILEEHQGSSISTPRGMVGRPRRRTITLKIMQTRTSLRFQTLNPQRAMYMTRQTNFKRREVISMRAMGSKKQILDSALGNLKFLALCHFHKLKTSFNDKGKVTNYTQTSCH